MPPLRPTNDEPGPYASACGLAELLIMFAARHGAEAVPLLLEKANRDKLTLRQTVKEVEDGGASDLAVMVKAAAKAAKKREPVWMTERRKVELERHKIMIRAFRRVTSRDVDAPIKPGKSYRMRFEQLKNKRRTG
jgi:hypothetical protein